MSRIKITYRYNQKIEGYSIGVRITYNCPKSARRFQALGYSSIFSENPFHNPDSYNNAHFEAIASAKKHAACPYNMVLNLKVEEEILIVWKIQEQKEIEPFVPNISYNEAQKKHGENFIPKNDYYFLKKYYNYNVQDLTESQKSKRIRLIIKYKTVIDTWPSRETRRKWEKTRQEIGE